MYIVLEVWGKGLTNITTTVRMIIVKMVMNENGEPMDQIKTNGVAEGGGSGEVWITCNRPSPSSISK